MTMMMMQKICLLALLNWITSVSVSNPPTVQSSSHDKSSSEVNLSAKQQQRNVYQAVAVEGFQLTRTSRSIGVIVIDGHENKTFLTLKQSQSDYDSNNNNDMKKNHKQIMEVGSIEHMTASLVQRIINRSFTLVTQQLKNEYYNNQKKKQNELEQQGRQLKNNVNIFDIGPRYNTTRTFSSSNLQEQQQKQQNLQQQNVTQVKETLELKWTIQENNQLFDISNDIHQFSEPCQTCKGTGILICQFCNGNGYVDFGKQQKGTVGEQLTKRNSRNSIECPICDENGEINCQDCQGSGWIANWRRNK